MRAVVLDSGAVTRLASRDRLSAARIGSLQRRGIWPPMVPSVVLAECLTGRQSIDAVTNRFLKGCDEERLPDDRERWQADRQAEPQRSRQWTPLFSMVSPWLLSTDPEDLGALAAHG